ncbi:hypothetical protein B0H14DRAFT_3860739 [Mycena olivaceomarginata]|nr:hypothetical protein B0H14DRAFT_3860739 [Mycena olivaceomarginata]
MVNFSKPFWRAWPHCLRPTAILIGRYFRTRRWWFNTHMVLQTFTAVLIIPSADPHHDLGLAILILFLIQFLIGVGAHYTRGGYAKEKIFPTFTTPKNPLRHTGMDEWDDVADNATLVPKGIRVAYWVFFGLAVGAYFVGWVVEAIPGHGGSLRQDSGSTEKEER